ISSQFDGLIGMDFMASYSMKIDSGKGVVIFEEVPENVNMPAGHDETWWRTTFQNFKSIRQSWEGYRDRLAQKKSFTDREKQIESFVQRQCERANDLYNKLLVHASTHSVPREWR
ncbi:MAG: hypothetical protein OEU95_05965, partial [Nitrospirota bacterium]|nr:hypothetical protein [Nitrospirota bacterium]